MGLFTGRHSIRAWEYALFEGKNFYFAMPDVKLYAKLTEQQIAADCNLILNSVEICRYTKDRAKLAQRKKLVKERYKHLLRLKPFADPRQKHLIKETEKAVRQMNAMR
jgi:hypothetical protein